MPNDLNAMKKYNLTHYELIEFTHKLAFSVRRDILEFADYNVTEADVDNMITLCSQFEALPSDEAYRNEIGSLTEEKENLKNELFKYSRNITTRAKIVFGENSNKYKTLNCRNLTKLPELELADACKYQSAQAKINLTALQAEGLTQEYLTAYNAKIEVFEAKAFDMKNKTVAREDATELRIVTANNLYTMIVRFCDYGKLIFDGISPAKYNDYIIYGREAGPVKPPVMIGYRPGDFVISWGSVENATSYELEYSPDGSAWTVAYSGSDDAVQYIPAVEGWAYFRCRARNSNGYGEFSEVLKAGYYQQIPPPSNIHAKIEENTDNGLILTWDAVPSAAAYKIYTSIVPIGEAEKDFILLKKTSATKFTAELELGMRHYFQIASENSAQSSLHSSSVHLDVEGALPS